MEVIEFLIDFVLHMDVYLNDIIANYGVWTYGMVLIYSKKRIKTDDPHHELIPS